MTPGQALNTALRGAEAGWEENGFESLEEKRVPVSEPRLVHY